MSLATVPRSAAPLATAGVLLLALAPLAVTTTLGAQDTLRPPAAAATLGHAPSAPAVRVSLGEEALVPGDHGRVSVRTRADGWVVVLQADPTGHVRVLFPLDPANPLPSERGQQTLGLSTIFSPTPFWAVSWQAQYTITDKRFESHVVRLERDLHEWRAAFNFVRNANGNVAFYFSIFLTDLPQLKFDYDQTSLGR